MKVRTIVAAMLLAVLNTQFASAQSNFTAGLSFGSNYSSLRSDLFGTKNGRLGFSAGLSFVVPLGSRFELSSEIAFIQKGATANASTLRPELPPAKSTWNYHYKAFEMGLLAGFQPIAGVPVRLQGGAFLDANSHNIEGADQNLFIGNVEDYNEAMPVEDVNDAFGGLDYGPVAGISLGSGRFRANFRYYYGLPNLYNYLEFMPEGHSVRSSAFRFTATYFIL